MMCSSRERKSSGNSGIRTHASRINHHTHRDVTEQVAVSRVAGCCRLGQLVQLADIVQHRTGKHQIAIGIVRTRQCVGGLRHLQDVIEEPALVRVMHESARPASTEAAPSRELTIDRSSAASHGFVIASTRADELAPSIHFTQLS